MLELCPILSQTLVGDLCIVQRQPKILEASNLRPDFRKKMVSYHPLTHTYPKPLIPISEKPVSWRFRKGITYPYLRNNIFPEFSLQPECMCNLCNLFCHRTDYF